MKYFRRQDRSEHLKVIIIGAGEVGFHIAQRLALEGKDVVVVDNKPESLHRLTEFMDVQTVSGSGASPKILDQAGIAGADVLLAVTDSDEINIIACFFANVLSPDTLKLARIRNEEYTLYQDALSKDMLDISMVINPEVEVVKNIDRLITVPGALEYNEFAGGKIKMVAMRVMEGHLSGTSLPELRVKMGVPRFIVAAIVREEQLIVPSGRDELRTDDIVYFVCEEKDLGMVREYFGYGHESVNSVLIIGGGNIGHRLANLLESKGYHTKIIDRDEARCSFLAEKLNKTIVLKGDGTDREVLAEENVDMMDVVVSLTGDEETNILSSLLARSMGAKKTITRINKAAYLPLVSAIGIEHSVSPRLSAVNSILQYVRGGSIISSVSIKGEMAEAMEAIAQENSDIVGKPLMDLNFPKGALLLCIIRGREVIIPTGDTEIHPLDKIIILSTSKAVSDVENALKTKLEYY